MNLIELQNKYNTHDKCIAHLEEVRWHGEPQCPHCESTGVTARAKMKKSKRGRKRKHAEKATKTPKYHCNSCNKDFTVLYGTIFEGSKMPLQKWFMLISIMLNARKGVSAMNIMRDLGITYKSAWYSAMRVRCAMLDQADMLEGVVEMDESYFGGKPRHRNSKDNVASLSNVEKDDWLGKDGSTNKRIDKRKFNKGRGTDKVKVVGIVERGERGRVALKVQDSLTSKDLLKMLKRYVNTDDVEAVMTDDFKSYKAFDKVVDHYSVNHSEKQYVKYIEGINHSIHTNTIEGVWSIIKNGIRGQYHVLSKKYLPFYLAEAAYKYNRRDAEGKRNAFNETITNAVNDEKCAVKYKPKAYPKFLATRRKKKKTKK
jgi:transposase-like protein